MNIEGTVSVWSATAPLSSWTALQHDTQADVCVVGAGIAGMMTAYSLARQGLSVVVLESSTVGAGQTGRTTAHLSNALDDGYYEIERLHDQNGARLAAESHTAAISRIESILSEEQIDCDFARLDGYLFAPPGESLDELEQERDAANRAGLTDVDWVARAPLTSFDTGRCLRFPRQAQFHPLKFLDALAHSFERRGGRIFTGTHVDKVTGGSPARAETRSGPAVTASAIVLATNTPIGDNLTIHTKQAPYRTYAIGARVAKNLVTRALYWDTLDPYHYVRLQDGNDLHDILIVGGEDHKQGESADGYQRFRSLEEWARQRFPVEQVEFRWSGMVMEPVDSMAFIGPDNSAQNIYIVTGDSGHGMTHGAIAGILLTDLISGRYNSWAPLYDPGRVTVRSATEFVKENLGVAADFLEWVTGGDVSSRDQIPPGSGAVVRSGLIKLAIYRDENGVFHEVSAVCPHLGCIVSWNATEKTWDCPCHGSGFDRYGKVIQGPSTADLTAKSV